MTDKADPPAVTVGAGPRIVVIGVGGAGGNAVNNMIQSGLEGVEFLAVNTDAQALAQSDCPARIQIGQDITQGLGCGARPDIGRAAAQESLSEILAVLEGANMAFITAGMGGGTGTGAAPVIARAAREAGILSVGVVTKPFHFEGLQRMRLADAGIDEFASFVDTLIVIPNQNLFRVADRKTTFVEAFKIADQVLHAGVRGVTDLMVTPGLINLDFADVRSVMTEMGKAIMGTGEAEGEGRALAAAEAAIANPLLDEVSMKGARGVLINITGGMDLTLFEIDEAANRVRDEIDPEANVIFGSTLDEKMDGRMRVSIVAAGIERPANAEGDDAGGEGAAPTPPIVRVYSEQLEKGLRTADETTPDETTTTTSGTPGADDGQKPETGVSGEPGAATETAAPQDTSTSRPSAPIFSFRARQKDSQTEDGRAQADSPDSPHATRVSGLGIHPASLQSAVADEHPDDAPEPEPADAPKTDTPKPDEPETTQRHGEETEPATEAPALVLREETKRTPPTVARETPPRETLQSTAPGIEPAVPTPSETATPSPPPRRKSGSIFGWIAGNGAGTADDLFRKGDRHYHGDGTRQNLIMAFKAYLRAAEMGHAAAQNRVGWMYEKGEGTEADHTLAVKWYRKAAEQDHVNAMNDLGYMYRQGWGVPQDYEKAHDWFSKAAARYDSYAEYNMGQMYENGWGVARDLDEAIRWFRRSAARGHEWAAKRLEELGVKT